MHRLAWIALALSPGLFLLAAAPGVSSSDDSAPTLRRQRLDTSRVVGWPDPPPPWRSKRVFEKHSFKRPVHLFSNPAHDLVFVVEQNGSIVSLPPSGASAPQSFLRIEDADTYAMTFHPEYKTNRLVYVFANGPNSAKVKKNSILRYKVIGGDAPRCDPASKTLIIEWESNGHNGGDLGFGRDGMLYITAGDGTSDSDTDNTGQDLKDLCSGMLRIDVDRPAPGKHYAIPPDNPFLKTPGARGELWAFGFRNPWRMTFHPDTGALLVGDVGQDLWEMIRLVTKGSNHGWSVTEGSAPFFPTRVKGPGPIVPPLIEHPHSESRSITGGVVYTGKKYPELRGVYIYGDYSTGKIWGIKIKDDKVTWKQDLAQTRLQIVGFGADRDGEVYIVDYSGQIHTLEPSPPVKGPSTFPRKLGDSGLVTSVKDYRLHPALIPYSVQSQLWSDGAHKERAIALPGLETIEFSESGFWKFPERTTIVKTFSLDLADGSRKRIETRFLTFQQGEWYGYSYAWRDDDSDADLVEAGGRARTYPVRDDKAPGGKRELAWRYPSRVECMVCHTRAASYVLGLSTAQMNRQQNYGAVSLHQFDALERLGVFKESKAKQWQALDEGVRSLSILTGALAKTPILAPVRSCCVEPAVSKVTKSFEANRKTIAAEVKKGGDTSRLSKPASEYPKLTDPSDTTAPLEARVRSYLHSNCAHCHVWAGGGNAAIDLHINTARDKMKLINEPPLHDRFGIKDAKLVAPGDPDRSILYQRLSRRGKGQMPPLASHRVDDQALDLVARWIRQLK